MELTPEHLEVARNAYFASLDGKGIIVTDGAYPAAHDLAEAGWSRREFVPDPENPDERELAWFWTGAADQAVGSGALMNLGEGRQN